MRRNRQSKARRNRQSKARRNRREVVNDLSGPDTMYKQLKDSFDMLVLDDSHSYSYDDLLNHFSGLWQEFCKRKNDARKYNKRITVEPRYFFNENKKRESVFYEGGTILQAIRDRALILTNNVNVQS